MNSKIWLLLALASSICRTLAQSAQYCNFPAGQQHPSENDFCIAVRAQRNHTTSHGDLYITIHVYRNDEKTLGWTALGIGASMAQSLSFIVYGDPDSGESPILSVRRLNGHWEPQAIDSAANTSEIKVLLSAAAWNTHSLNAEVELTVSEVTFICFSCDTGLDSDLEPLVSLGSFSQPWIWAKNTEQRLAEFSDTSTLEMHSLKNGWGAFYMDMTQTVALIAKEAVAPAIKPDVSAVATSATDRSLSPDEPPKRASLYRTQASLHGFFMSLAFLLLFPCGVLAILSSHPSAVQRHRMLQVAAMVSVFIGCVLGLFLQPHLPAAHQKLGFATSISVGLQALIGMYHHVTFLRRHRRTWVSDAHVYLGRVVLGAGYCSIVTGLLLHKTPMLTYVVVGAIMASNLGWIVWAKLHSEEPCVHAGAYQLVKAEDD